MVNYQEGHISDKKKDFLLPEKIYHYRSWFLKLAALAVVSKEGIVLEINDLFTKLYGYQRSEIVDKRISILKSNSTAAETHKQIWETINSGYSWSGELENKKKSGESVFVRCTIVPTSNNSHTSNTEHDDCLVIYQDITVEILHRERDKEQAVEAARQAMLAGALHNIGNLQQAVSVANNNVIEQVENLSSALKMAEEELGKIEDCAERLGFFENIFNVSMLSLERISSSATDSRSAITDTISVLEGFRRHQKNILQMEIIPLQEFVRRILNVFNIRLMGKGIKLDVSCSFSDDLVITWPVDRVQQVVFNLLKNAEDAVTEAQKEGVLAEGKILLTVSTEKNQEDSEYISFTVSDNGGGFDVPASKLFEQNFTTKSYGIGIGLHNSVLLTQSINGKLKATNSTLNGQRGATFILTIPAVLEVSTSDDPTQKLLRSWEGAPIL